MARNMRREKGGILNVTQQEQQDLTPQQILNLTPAAFLTPPESNCRVRLPWRGLVTGSMCPGRGQMSSTGAGNGQAYSHARHLILMH